MRTVPMAAPPMVTNSAGWMRTRRLPCSIRYPAMTQPNTTTMPIIANMVNSLNSTRRRRIGAGGGGADRRRGSVFLERVLRPQQKRFDGIAQQSRRAPGRNYYRQFLSPPFNRGAARHPQHAFAHGLQSLFAAAAQDHQKPVFAPTADEISRPYRVPQGTSQHPQDGRSRLLPVPGAKLAEFPHLHTNHTEGDLKLRERPQHFPQVRLHQGVVRQFGGVIQAAAVFHALIVRVGPVDGKLAFESLDDADDRAVLV